jgi:hypothetical protein
VSVIADLARAGVDPDLIDRVATAIADARVQGMAEAMPMRTPGAIRQERYRRNKASLCDVSDAIVTVCDADFPRAVIPPAHTHASALDFSNGSSFQSEPVIELETPICPQDSAKPKREAKRGTRLPEDWVPCEKSILACLVFGYSRAYLLGEGLDGFRDYWLALSGASSLKSNWERTFCNRMRERLDRDKLVAKCRGGPTGNGVSTADQGRRFIPAI